MPGTVNESSTKPHTEPKLEPCPFCGGAASYDERSGMHYVRCETCAQTGDIDVSVLTSSKSKSYELWNTRTRLSPASAAPVVDMEFRKRAASATHEIVERWFTQDLPDRARVFSSPPQQLRVLVADVLSKHFAAATAAPQTNNCPKCGGSGEIEIGCAMDHALTASCVECGGSGHATASPVEQSELGEAYYRMGQRESQLAQKILTAVEAEHLDGYIAGEKIGYAVTRGRNEDDIAYDNAINHVVSALRELFQREGVEVWNGVEGE